MQRDLQDFQLLRVHRGHRKAPCLLRFLGYRPFPVAPVLHLAPSIPADPKVRSIQLVPRIIGRKLQKINYFHP